ncbi:hypothetical protein VKT23_007802 [Stygiomarasmius scandens]|uniref:Uncharacterized protein n=1 Tax=Marasmiellus scandens TaxID=2682957 RepID=A0ABR1JJA1_9AGAR
MSNNSDAQADTAAMLAEYADFQLFRQFRAQSQAAPAYAPFTNLTNANPTDAHSIPTLATAPPAISQTQLRPTSVLHTPPAVQLPPVDVIQPYRPIDDHDGRPAAPHTVSATPFSSSGGFRDLVSQANADRLATADRYRSTQPEPLPRQLTRTSRTQNSGNTTRSRRVRGPAIHPPGLPRRGPPNPRDSVFSDPQTGQERCRLQVNVHLRDEGGSNRVLFHTTRANQVEAFRAKMCLDPQFQLPLSTTVLSIMELVYEHLTTCQYHYSLPPTSHDLLGRPEPPFLLLEFTNSGRRNTNTNSAYLRTCRPNHSMTVDQLLSERNIAIPQWVLKEVLDVDNVEADFSLQDARLGTDSINRRHLCLAQRFHLPWYFGVDARIPIPDVENGFCECADEAEVAMEVQETLLNEGVGTPNGTSTASNASNIKFSPPSPAIPQTLSRQGAVIFPPASTNVPVSRSREDPHHGEAARDASSSSTTILTSVAENANSETEEPHVQAPTIPLTLFPSEFTLLSGETIYDITDLESFHDEAMKNACPSLISAPRLRVSGTSAVDAAQNFLDLVRECVRNNDFGVLLSRNRHFEVDSTSFGEGVETEIVSMAWRILTQSFTYFFRMSAGDKCTIATSVPLYLSALIPSTRLEDMAVLGAMAALMMVYGKYPEPLSPAILQFFLYGAEPRALGISFVSEWLPELFHDLRRFENTEPNGDLNSFNEVFATYTNFEVSALLFS